jgi:hypothetical protein
MEYLTTLVHHDTSMTVRVGDDLVTLRTDSRGVGYQDRDGMADPAIDPVILDDFRAMPPTAGWMVGPWERGPKPEALPLYQVDPTAVSREEIVASVENRLQAKDGELAACQQQVKELQAQLATLMAENAALRKQPPTTPTPAAPMVDERGKLTEADKPSVASAKRARNAKKDEGEGEGGSGERQPVISQTNDDDLDGIPTA